MTRYGSSESSLIAWFTAFDSSSSRLCFAMYALTASSCSADCDMGPAKETKGRSVRRGSGDAARAGRARVGPGRGRPKARGAPQCVP